MESHFYSLTRKDLRRVALAIIKHKIKHPFNNMTAGKK